MEDLKITDLRELLVKKPFFEVTPNGYMKHDLFNREVTDKENPSMPEDTLYRRIKTQADFLREFYPSDTASGMRWNILTYTSRTRRTGNGTYRRS